MAPQHSGICEDFARLDRQTPPLSSLKLWRVYSGRGVAIDDEAFEKPPSPKNERPAARSTSKPQ